MLFIKTCALHCIHPLLRIKNLSYHWKLDQLFCLFFSCSFLSMKLRFLFGLKDLTFRIMSQLEKSSYIKLCECVILLNKMESMKLNDDRRALCNWLIALKSKYLCHLVNQLINKCLQITPNIWVNKARTVLFTFNMKSSVLYWKV